MSVVELRSVHKTYRARRRRAGRVAALDGLDLEVPPGGVFGLLGPNGSGKTTAIRLLLGLARADSGDISLLGRPVPRSLAAVRDRVGALVETPKFMPSFTGRLNLELLAGLKGVDLALVPAVLERVGLSDRADSRVGGYSLGMRQRLAVAAAMLGEPDVLVLDEPANGLDPAGIAAMRDLLVAFGRSGRTVLVSSHHLADVERICDRVAIMSDGRVVAAGTIPELSGATARLALRVSDCPRARSVLDAAGIASVEDDEPGRLLVDAPAGGGAEVVRVLASEGVFPSEVVPVGSHLEEVYLRLTGTDPLAGER